MNYKEIVSFWQQQNVQTSADLSAILDSYSINFAFHSGKIENDNITYHDTREIFEKDGVTSYTGDLRTLFEIRNAKTAYEAILLAFEQKQPLTEEFVKDIQKLLTINTYDTRRYQLGERPGLYKKGDYVTGAKEVGALADDVSEEMSELLEDLSSVKDENALVAAAFFHAKFENIHPFSDGNGRTGRLLMNYFLLLHNHPPITIHETDRKAYYTALEHFDDHLDLELLIDFLVLQTEKTWAHYLDRSTRSKITRCSLDEALQVFDSRKSPVRGNQHDLER